MFWIGFSQVPPGEEASYARPAPLSAAEPLFTGDASDGDCASRSCCTPKTPAASWRIEDGNDADIRSSAPCRNRTRRVPRRRA